MRTHVLAIAAAAAISAYLRFGAGERVGKEESLLEDVGSSGATETRGCQDDLKAKLTASFPSSNVLELGQGGFGCVAAVKVKGSSSKLVYKMAIASGHQFMFKLENKLVEYVGKHASSEGAQHVISPPSIAGHADLQSDGKLIGMAFAGQELATFQAKLVEQVIDGKMTPERYLQVVAKVARDLVEGAHFLASLSLVHNDLKFSNVAVRVSDEYDDISKMIALLSEGWQPHATIIDLGTASPCWWISEDTVGTRYYKPPIQAERALPDNYNNSLVEILGSDVALEWTQNEELEAGGKVEADYPCGSQDGFGVGIMLAEMLYGIRDRSADGKYWNNQLWRGWSEGTLEDIRALQDSTQLQNKLKDMAEREHGNENPFLNVVSSSFAEGVSSVFGPLFDRKEDGTGEALKSRFFSKFAPLGERMPNRAEVLEPKASKQKGAGALKSKSLSAAPNCNAMENQRDSTLCREGNSKACGIHRHLCQRFCCMNPPVH